MLELEESTTEMELSTGNKVDSVVARRQETKEIQTSILRSLTILRGSCADNTFSSNLFYTFTVWISSTILMYSTKYFQKINLSA